LTNEPAPEVTLGTSKTYRRFDRSQRIEHAVFLISFTILGITGLAQKFATSIGGEFLIRLMGGIETTRIIHHTAAIVLMAIAIYHILGLLYRVFVHRVKLSIMPKLQDFRDLMQDVLFYLGLRSSRARYGRYSYVEKAEYWALVWGTIIMAITGFMMWNPISSARLLPGETIPAAKAAHGGEALLAVSAIILWHFYHVHIRHLNMSMFTGWLTRKEMEHEHPTELDEIDAGLVPPDPAPEVIRKREAIYIPIAAVLALVMGFSLFAFVTFEDTAIKTVPPGESVAAFLPLTPTPAPTPVPSPTSDETLPASWVARYEGLLRDRCSTCHGFTTVGGLSLASYELALAGGNNGPALVPRDPEASLLVVVQSAGNHPGQLSPEELDDVIAWIEAGAPER
jgi:cytochrome b subunit of formate dehydrogenase/mono/diheme cytochrome c family protein